MSDKKEKKEKKGFFRRKSKSQVKAEDNEEDEEEVETPKETPKEEKKEEKKEEPKSEKTEKKEKKEKEAAQDSDSKNERFDKLESALKDFQKSMKEQFDKCNDRIDSVEKRLAKVEGKVTEVSDKVDQVKLDTTKQIDKLREEMKESGSRPKEEQKDDKAVKAEEKKKEQEEKLKEKEEKKKEKEAAKAKEKAAKEKAKKDKNKGTVEGEEDIGPWEDDLSESAKKFVTTHDLSKKINWIFRETPLSSEDLKAMGEAIKGSPKGKNIVKLEMNLSADLKIRDMKDFAVLIMDKESIKELVMIGFKRTAGWTLLSSLVEASSTITSVTLEGVEFFEVWSGAQFGKILSHCAWEHLTIKHATQKPTSFNRTDATTFFDDVGYGLAANTTLKSFRLIDIPGACNGDIDKMLFKMKRNNNLVTFEVSLQDVWERSKIKSLTSFLEENTSIQNLILKGAEESIFEVTEFVNILEKSQTLRLLDCNQLNTVAGTTHGLSKVESSFKSKLTKIVEANPKLEIHIGGITIPKK